MFGSRTVVKIQTHEHQRVESLIALEAMRNELRIPAARLLDHGTLPNQGRWWAVLERIEGSGIRQAASGRGHAETALVYTRQRAVAAVLRRWHDGGVPAGLALDDPGAIGLFFAEIREFDPGLARRLSRQVSEICEGAELRAVHGDVGAGHNALFRGEELVALLDPGVPQSTPAMLCLAWCTAVDLGYGGSVEAAVEGYGEDGVDADRFEALLPLMVRRRYMDMRRLGHPAAEVLWHWWWTHSPRRPARRRADGDASAQLG